MSIRPDIPPLSPREQQLIEYAAKGLTDTAIALKLGISEATVGTYWGRVRIKIGPYNRTELVSIYLRNQQEAELAALRQENAKMIAELQAAVVLSALEENFFHEIVDNAPDAMILVSETGLITNANHAAAELFGYERQEMEGLSLIELIPERFREKHVAHREEYVHHPQRRTMGEHLETPALRKDGVEMIVRASLSAIPSPTGLIVTCVLREAKREE